MPVRVLLRPGPSTAGARRVFAWGASQHALLRAEVASTQGAWPHLRPPTPRRAEFNTHTHHPHIRTWYAAVATPQAVLRRISSVQCSGGPGISCAAASSAAQSSTSSAAARSGRMLAVF
jgi:hypothetical protein